MSEPSASMTIALFFFFLASVAIVGAIVIAAVAVTLKYFPRTEVRVTAPGEPIAIGDPLAIDPAYEELFRAVGGVRDDAGDQAP